MGVRCVMLDLDDTLISNAPHTMRALSTAARSLGRSTAGSHRLADAVSAAATDLWAAVPDVRGNAELTDHSALEALWSTPDPDRYRPFDSCALLLDYRLASFSAALQALRPGPRCTPQDLLARFLAEKNRSLELDAAARRLLDLLAATGRSVVLVTNGNAVNQAYKVGALGLRRRGVEVVLASNEGGPKPAPEPFLRALRLASTAAREGVMIGDNYRTDIEGAAAVGIRGVHVGDRAHGPSCTRTTCFGSVSALVAELEHRRPEGPLQILGEGA